MPNNYTIYSETASRCNDASTHVTEICLPLRVDCDPVPLDLLITDCESRWNCSLKQTDRAYFVPYNVGDKIHLQTLFYDDFNPDHENPITGWDNAGTGFMQAELLDLNGNVISSTLSEFADRWFVAWNGERNYQIVELNTQTIETNFPALTCWNIRLTARNSLAVTTQLCSQDFAKNVCHPTVLVKGEYDSNDCLEQYYGDPVASVGTSFKFDNSLRYWAHIRELPSSSQKTIYSSRTVRVELDDNFQFVPKQILPPFMTRMLTKVHLSAKEVYLNGEEYRIDNVSAENQLTNTRMSYFTVNLYKECDTDFRC